MINLCEIAKIKTGLVLSRKKADQNQSKSYYNVVSLKSFNNYAVYDDIHEEEFISSKEIKDDYKVKQGDILLRLREPNFAVFIDKDYENLIYTSHMVNIKLHDNRFDANFIAHYLNSNIVKKSLSSELSGTTITMIKVANVNEIKIPLISLDKQKKIVEYLRLAYQENEFLQNMIELKQKYSKEIFETILKKENI